VQLHARVEGREVQIEVRRLPDGRFLVSLDGAPARTLERQPCGAHTVSLLEDGRSHTVTLERRSGGYTAVVGRHSFAIELHEAVPGRTERGGTAASGPSRLLAPMPGKIVRVLATPGQAVEAGAGLVVMEAMKMENELKATRAGRLAEVAVVAGQTVEAGQLIAVVD